ncbi:Mur ligase [Podospora appendiculata]|uniref:Folylpolyglutamate synthase n=1 Tax=Podospora appendiculata TaxID=314037 RepID=A0AAE1CG85_9PEZI|nr:Mur ligase [Podospora appendiculata]
MLARDYPTALSLLASLQSNQTVVSLFASGPPSADLNALAIPEMLAWLARAGHTPASLAAAGLRCIHVAGTKGKGSVSALAASILQQYPAACPVGTYTSPHVLTVRERIVLDGAPISADKFARYFFEVWDALTAAAVQNGDVVPPGLGGVDGPATKPFYFRFLTILALHAFVREGVRSAVIECGIGGEYDATNVLPKEAVTAAVVTQLGIDHVNMLGSTVEEIAWHKAGVWREGVKGFTRRVEGEGKGEGEGEGVMAVLRERAREKGVSALVEVEDREVDEWEGVEGARLEGPWQKMNMALAAAAAREHLRRIRVRVEGRFGEGEGGGLGLADMPVEFVRGLKAAKLPGRCEVVTDREGVEWFVDGAHTAESLAGVGEWFAGKTRTDDGEVVRVLVFNQQDRDPAVLLGALLGAFVGRKGLFAHAVFTRNEELPPADGETRDLAVQSKALATLRGAEGFEDTEAVTRDSVRTAVERVREIARRAGEEGKTCEVLVTGSFHLVGALLKTIGHVED